MTKLYLNTASSKLEPVGTLPGMAAETYQVTNRISKAAASALLPGEIAINNLADTISNPGNIFKGSTYKEVLKLLPKSILHELALTARLPFATVDKAIEHFLLNNMERIHQTIKGTTYGTIANILIGKNPSTFRKYSLGAIGKGIEYLGDGVGSLVKSPFWLVHKPFEYINDKLKPVTQKTEDSLSETKIYDTPYFNPGILKAANNTDYEPSENTTKNTGYKPSKIDLSKLKAANNTNYEPEKKAA